MFISKIRIKNFRLLKDTTLLLNEDKKQDLSLLIGRNNSGKTSFIMLFDKFYRNESFKFNFYDFSTSLRDKIFKIDKTTVIEDLSIQMILEIKYDLKDSLENISDFILIIKKFSKPTYPSPPKQYPLIDIVSFITNPLFIYNLER